MFNVVEEFLLCLEGGRSRKASGLTGNSAGRPCTKARSCSAPIPLEMLWGYSAADLNCGCLCRRCLLPEHTKSSLCPGQYG